VPPAGPRLLRRLRYRKHDQSPRRNSVTRDDKEHHAAHTHQEAEIRDWIVVEVQNAVQAVQGGRDTRR
jgi:hypothetical protein